MTPKSQDPSTSDPKTQGPKPEFPQKKIDAPGSDAELTPRADHGEDSYRGLGRLAAQVDAFERRAATQLVATSFRNPRGPGAPPG